MLDQLDKLVSIEEALMRWPGRFTRPELMKACREERLHHVKKGRRRLVTEEWLCDYLATMEKGPWPNEGAGEATKSALSSAATGSGGNNPAGASIDTGMTREQEEAAAKLLRQKLGKRPNRSSRRS